MTERAITGPETVKTQLEAWGLKNLSMKTARKLVREIRNGEPRDAQGVEVSYFWKYEPEMIGRAVRHVIAHLPKEPALDMVKLVEQSFHGSARSGLESVIPRLDELIQEHLQDKAA